jgi:two-component system phosphate regulon sensor histidine kinase PhoR
MTDRTRRVNGQLGYRRIVQMLVFLVIIPTVLLLLVGIITMLLRGGGRVNLVLGILTVSFVAVVGTGVVLTLVFVRREASLSELQTDFVSKVSHELRTPLTAIRLFAETLERTTDEATQKKCVEHLSTETERLTRRIERLLDWGRMEAGRRYYVLRREPVAEVVEEAVAAFSPVRYDDVDFHVQIAKNLPDIEVDRAALVDAVVNLLSNAYKYGGAPPKIDLAVDRDEHGAVAIRIKDNGAGIERREHRRIFDKFYRIDDRLSRDREGSGLGLAIVKHVVKGHKARITIQSQPGAGSTFTLLFPALKPIGKTRERLTETEAT